MVELSPLSMACSPPPVTVDAWLEHAPLGLIVVGLLVAGLGVPIPEDPLLLAAGVAARMRGLPLPLVIVVCAGAVLAADFMLFSIARHYGPHALEHGTLARLLPPARREALERMIARRGDAVVFVARHLPGLRAPIFALVGMHGIRRSRFLLWDGLGLCITAPLVVTIGWFGADHFDRVSHRLARVEHWIALVLVVAGLVTWWIVAWRKRRRVEHGELPPPADPPPA